MRSLRAIGPPAGWAALLVAGWWVLLPRSADMLAEVGDPGGAAVLAVRLMGLLLLCRLSAASIVAALGALLRSGRLVLTAERLAPRALRPMVHRWCTSGLLLVATTTGVAVPAQAALAGVAQPGTSAASDTVEPPTMWRLDPADSAGADADPTTTASPERPDVGPGTTGTTGTGVPDVPDVPDVPEPSSASPSTTEDAAGVPNSPGDGDAEGLEPTWTIAPGQHLWGIAERVVGDRLGHPPTVEDVATYHHALIEENRHRLADPDNPDLVFAGQVLSLPG